MAGKSTYLRQNALITLLAQIGSFVPAREAHIGIVDRIFCRVGASDNLARGESTFLVEMTETALILREATDKSLVIMDEVGRGTSTEDGLSIAWAVSEYLLDTLKCKTLFATHYHELTRITHPALLLLCLKVLEQDGHVVFLKQIIEGASANSYGIHVARLAGIPESVIIRSRDLLGRLQTAAGDSEDIGNAKEEKGSADAVTDVPPPAFVSAGLFSEEELIIDEILSLKPDAITPLEALQMVSRWKKELSGER
jgi:DNA mismatch repair protein MutS